MIELFLKGIKDMDLNTKLKDETIFSDYKYSYKTLQALNKRGIITIKDFLDASIDDMTNDDYIKRKYIVYKHIFEYKYLGILLPFGDLLDKSFGHFDSIKDEIRTLDFTEYDFFFRFKLPSDNYYKLIEIIGFLP